MFGWIGILVGILLVLFGGYLVVFFPAAPEHQAQQMTAGAIILGFICLVIGGILLFF